MIKLIDILKEALSEEKRKGLWYYINRKKKLGIKSSPKNSKQYKSAVKAGKELSNESIDTIKYTNLTSNTNGKKHLDILNSKKWVKRNG